MSIKLTKLFCIITAATTIGTALADQVLTVAATPIPQAEILEQVKPVLKKEGIDLQIKVFSDYIQPNRQVTEGNVDANYFEHKPYLDTYNQKNHTDLVSVGAIHVEPFGLYSHKYHNIDQLPNNATIAIPNDPSNEGRALLLLQQHHLITLKDPKNLLATPEDIVKNPKNLHFKTLDAALLPRVLPDVDAAMINANYALQAHINPVKQSLIIEDKDSPYANLIVTTPAKKDNADIQALVKALQTPAIKAFIEKKYKGAIVPAF